MYDGELVQRQLHRLLGQERVYVSRDLIDSSFLLGLEWNVWAALKRGGRARERRSVAALHTSGPLRLWPIEPRTTCLP